MKTLNKLYLLARGVELFLQFIVVKRRSQEGQDADSILLFSYTGDTYSVGDGQMNHIVFETFYEEILRRAVGELRRRICEKSAYFSEALYVDFSEHLAGQLQALCLRTLIVQMHYYKQAVKLKWKNSREEYEFFCQEVIGQKQFALELFRSFPVLKTCIEKKLEYMTAYYREIIFHFCKDREEIRRGLCPRATRITKISGNFSDVHNDGRQVLRIELDNTCELLYKPHSMENEEKYSGLLRWLSEKTGIGQLEYSFLSFDDHSWCSIVDYKACRSQIQLENYYIRMGVHIFLTYFLGTKDLHYENIIASGEYPVLIDLETLVHVRYKSERNTAKEEMIYQLSQSVLYSGLLPFYHWNKDGNGIDSSGMRGSGGQKYPFKTPVIVKAGTSDMHIEYRYLVSKKAQNLATVEGEFYEPGLYKEQILDGFMSAYKEVISRRDEFGSLLKELEQTKSRYLTADTQRYSMLLSGSYHPRLLVNDGEREKFLDLLWQGRSASDEAIVKSEITSLMNGDIPYFYYSLNGTSLFTAQGDEVKHYFSCPAMTILTERLKMLSESDMKKQEEFIGVSLDLMDGERDGYFNGVYLIRKGDLRKEIQKDAVRKSISEFKTKLVDNAVWNTERTEVGWYALQLSSSGQDSWDIRPMNMYLYDGLAGILLILYALELYEEDREISHMRIVLEQMLFGYTDEGAREPERLQTKNTGAYNGESSVLYTYLVLYQLTGRRIYMDYAKKHAQIIDRLLGEDKSFDLLSGNGGAAQVLLKMYVMLNDRRYLDMAVRAVEVLERTAVIQTKGIGWSVEGDAPAMAGMAHGNSGILMPVISLWKITGEEKYERLAEQIWQYEEYVYDERINNWTDLRSAEEQRDDIGPVAWCHGAGGILLSRLKCCEDLQDDMWRERFGRDISRACAKLSRYWKRDSFSLCHGIYGNLMILERAAKKVYWPAGNVKLLPQEKINPGLMNGYGGILYFLLKQEIPALPDILGLD